MRLLPVRFELGGRPQAAADAPVAEAVASAPAAEAVAEAPAPPKAKAPAREVALSGDAILKLQVVVSVGVAVFLGVLAQRYMVDDQNLERGLIVWAVAIGVFGFGVWRAGVLAQHGVAARTAATLQAQTITPALEVALFCAVFAFCAFFYFYRLGSIPPGLNHDAAWEGLHAIEITKGMPYHPYVAEAWGRETGYHYFVAGIQLIIGPSWMAIKLASVILGLALLPVFYLFIRRLFDWRMALISTTLLGLSGWNIVLGKVGWRSSFVPFFVALVFYFVVRAVETRKLRDWVLAGVFLGLSLDTYDAARVLPAIAAVYLGYEIVRDRTLLTKNPWHLVAFAAAFLIAFAPLGWWAYNNWTDFSGRGRFLWETQIQANGYVDPLWTNFKTALLIFNWRANGDDFFVREPLVDLPASVFLVFGFALALLRWRERPYFLLIVMLLAALCVGIVSEPNGNRNIVAMIPVYAFAGLFVYEAWRWLSSAYPNYQQWFSIAVVGVLLYTGYATYDTYLGPDRRDIWGFYPEGTQVGRYMDKIAPEYEIYAAAGNWPRDALTYLSYQGQDDPFVAVYKYNEHAECLLFDDPNEPPTSPPCTVPGDTYPLSTLKGTAFIVEDTPENAAVVETLRERYPEAGSAQIYYGDKLVANVVLVRGSATAVPAEDGETPTEDGDTPAVAPGAAERDAERRSGLLLIAAALLGEQQREGSFPDTGGNVQTACVYVELDSLCDLPGDLEFIDPRGDGTTYGYWYESDGDTFTLYASLETDVSDDESCTPDVADLAKKPNLLCMRGGEAGGSAGED